MQKINICPNCGTVGIRETEMCGTCIDGRAPRSDEIRVNCSLCSRPFFKRKDSNKDRCPLCTNKKILPRTCLCGNVFRSSKFDSCPACRVKKYIKTSHDYQCGLCGSSFVRHDKSNRSKEYCDECYKLLELKEKILKGEHIPKEIRSQLTIYDTAKKKALERNLTWNLTNEQYFKITAQSCYYCGVGVVWKYGNVGLDRLDNDLGYQEDNVVSCCGSCNMIRGNKLTPGEMYAFMEGVLRFRLAENKFKKLIQL